MNVLAGARQVLYEGKRQRKEGGEVRVRKRRERVNNLRVRRDADVTFLKESDHLSLIRSSWISHAQCLIRLTRTRVGALLSISRASHDICFDVATSPIRLAI